MNISTLIARLAVQSAEYERRHEAFKKEPGQRDVNKLIDSALLILCTLRAIEEKVKNKNG